MRGGRTVSATIVVCSEGIERVSISAAVGPWCGAGVALRPRDEPTAELSVPSRRRNRAPSSRKFLVKSAEKAAKSRDWARAIPLYQALVVARGPASPEQQAARDAVDARRSERGRRRGVGDLRQRGHRGRKRRARRSPKSTRLAATPDPFAEKLSLAALDKEAKQAFKLGRAAFKAKQYGDALVYFHMGYALAPDLPGFLRELGSTYDKLGATDRKKRVLPPLPRAAPVRCERRRRARRARADKDVLGTLLVSSSLPCAELWMNRQRITGKLPDKGLLVAPGSYKGLCFNPKYEMALFEYATVEAGQAGDHDVPLGDHRQQARAALRPHRAREPEDRRA